MFISGAARNSNRSDYCVERVVIAPDSGSLTLPRGFGVDGREFRIADFIVRIPYSAFHNCFLLLHRSLILESIRLR
jgi:hypothetical protein